MEEKPVNKVLELLKLLPNFEDIETLVKNEVEARYILKRALHHLHHKVSRGEGLEDAEESGYLIRALVDKTWERIHSGHFSKVPLETRRIYALACYCKIFFMLFEAHTAAQLERCSVVIDDAQLLGSTDDLCKLHPALMKYLDDNSTPGITGASLPTLTAEPRRSCRCDIAQLVAPSLSEFKQRCFEPEKPALLLNTINHWPALSKWRDLNYIHKVAGNRTVPIEIGLDYASDEWSQQLVKLSDFLQRQFNQTNNDEIEYLAQHELFAQIPALKADICVPDYCILGSGVNPMETVDIKAWLGPKGTVSPMHYDPKHNLLCQVFGSKRIILAEPASTTNLYPHESEFLSNTSQIDAANLDFKRYPLLSHVSFYELVLQPGDSLYMPPKWWHYVHAETPSFSVSFWWD